MWYLNYLLIKLLKNTILLHSEWTLPNYSTNSSRRSQSQLYWIQISKHRIGGDYINKAFQPTKSAWKPMLLSRVEWPAVVNRWATLDFLVYDNIFWNQQGLRNAMWRESFSFLPSPFLLNFSPHTLLLWWINLEELELSIHLEEFFFVSMILKYFLRQDWGKCRIGVNPQWPNC